MRRPAVIVLLTALVLLGGCRTRKLPPDASATTQPATTETTQPTTTTTLNLAAPPTPAQLQDPAYWNAILAALNHVVGDAFRSAAIIKTVEPAAIEELRQVYGSTLFQDEHEVLAEVAAGRGNGILIPPGDAAAEVSKVLRANGRCIALVASLDYGKVNPTVARSTVAVKLLPRPNNQDTAVNPTAWTIDELFVINTPDDGSRLCTD